MDSKSRLRRNDLENKLSPLKEKLISHPLYDSIKELYYSNYVNGKNGSPVNTASFNNDGTITGPAYTPNYYNYLSTTLQPNRYFPTGSDQTICVISIPSNLYGEHIKLNSVTLQSKDFIAVDDGLGNMLSGSEKVGDIIYQQGMAIISNLPESRKNVLVGCTYITCSFESTMTIYESQYKCTFLDNEFNYTQNPSAISSSSNSGTVYDFLTGSYFQPYITTVGLYNNANELVAVGKLAQPLQSSNTTDTTILVNLDL